MYVEREPSEIKNRVVIIIEDLNTGGQSYIPLKECVFYWVEALLSQRWGGGGWVGCSGWDVSQLSE